MKTKLFICTLAISAITMVSCSNEDGSFPSNPPQTSSRSVNENLVNYLTVVNGQWVITISEQEAVDMGKSDEYEKLIGQMAQINTRIKELHSNPEATIGFNLPTNERIVMRSGKILSKTRISPWDDAINTRASLITSMNVNQSTKFNTRSDEYKITSRAYVQSMFLWSFELRDDKWNNYWNESGVGSANLSREWTYSLSRPGTDNAWMFSSSGTSTDGTGISFTFYK